MHIFSVAHWNHHEIGRRTSLVYWRRCPIGQVYSRVTAWFKHTFLFFRLDVFQFGNDVFLQFWNGPDNLLTKTILQLCPRMSSKWVSDREIFRITNLIELCVDRDSSVGIATRYGIDGPGIGCRWRARVSVPVQTGPGAHPPLSKMGTGFPSRG
jgi:hypothetical protein